ncbi:MAG: ATP-binding protein [Anaerolineales bacterium]|nr:ATP-binding protein [Anaerolineales bacterium]
MSIRIKVILPYLLLTLVVSLIGVYVVTQLVTGTLRERLTNQLLEAGRIVSDNFVRLEVQHVADARRITFTEGVAEALANEDRETLYNIVSPIFGTGEIGNLIFISPSGNEILHLILDDANEVRRVEVSTSVAESVIVSRYLTTRNVDEPPSRGLGGNLVNNETYYYTSLPVSSLEGEFRGVIIVGTPVRRFLPYLKSVALADVALYGSDGRAIVTTLGTGNPEALDIVSISEAEYQSILRTEEDFVTGENFELDKRAYTIGRAPLQVGNNRVGVFAVILPMDFVIQSGQESRTTYVALFTALMIGVIVIGVYVVTRWVITPLFSLVRTSQAIAAGDLNRRTGIHNKDEIGKLAGTFDEMTSRLQDRTLELERTNAILQKIDRTKTNFIQISAHELRTPLTLIMGYSQMLEQDTQKDPDLLKLAQGILEGSERMSDVVDSMLDVSRIDSDALVLRRTSLQLELVVDKVKKNFKKDLKERNIKFETRGLETLPVVSADPDMLQKVFHHLVMNAIKYTPDGGEILVAGRYSNGDNPPRVEIEVSDTGIGIDPSMKDMIFEKFHQTGEVLLHSSGKTKFKGGGPGLGLAIARGIVQAHGGQIWVESPGYSEETFPGSKFIVSLPLPNDEGRAA